MNRREFIKSFGLVGGALAVGGSITGCKSIPTVSQMTVMSELIGRSSGLIVNNTKISDKDKATVVEILNKVCEVTPADGQTYADCWYNAALDYVNPLSLDENVKTLILAAIKVAGEGVDYIFTKRYPDAKQYADLVAAAIHGFVDGFTSVVTPPNSTTVSTAKLVYDEEAYLYLKAKFL